MEKIKVVRQSKIHKALSVIASCCAGFRQQSKQGSFIVANTLSDFELPDETFQKYTASDKRGNTWVTRLHYNINMLSIELKELASETLKLQGAQVNSILEYAPNQMCLGVEPCHIIIFSMFQFVSKISDPGTLL